ncbi:MAG: dihydrodipicolinate synthase family protein [Gemmatimonadaceae bacterium]
MPLALSGILAPVITPFDAAGELDRGGFEGNVRAHLAAGLAGIVVAGSTGEAALLDEAERRSLVRWARAVVPPERLLIAGAGAESTRQAIRLARAAAEDGADAVLVVAPHYYGGNAMTSAALHAHFAHVADASPVPVLLYNIPKYAHFVLNPELVHELSVHGNIVGIKDSSGDLSLLSTYLNAQTERFAVFTGNAQVLATALRSGVKGGILAVSTFLPELTLAVYDRAAAGDATAATAAQGRLTPVAAEIVGTMGVAGVKAAHDAVGLVGGAPRSPLLPATDEVREQVKALIAGATAAAAR